MRCAVRRLVSRGKSVDRPRAVRDSEAIQATTPQGLGTTRPRRPPRRAGRRWLHARPPMKQRRVYVPRPHGKRQPPRKRPRRGERCGAGTRPRNPKHRRIQRRPWEPRCQRGGVQQQPGEEGRKRGHGRRRFLGGRRRPGFSNSGETEVNSATAEQTTSRTLLWRKTRSPPQQQERRDYPSDPTPPHTCHRRSRDPMTANEACAAEPPGREEKRRENWRTTGQP